jgi:ABC-type transporter Mla subunit MlaD
MPVNPRPTPSVEALIDQWRAKASDLSATVDNLLRINHGAFDDTARQCDLEARLLRTRADELAAALSVSRCDAFTSANQVSDGGRCVLPVGHAGDHALAAPEAE